MRRRAVCTPLGVAAAAVLLTLAAPLPTALRTLAANTSNDVDPGATVGAAAAVTCWLLVAWCAASITLVLAARSPGVVGTVCARAAARITPAVLRQALGAGTAAGVVLAPVAAPAVASAAPGAATHVRLIACDPGALPSLDRSPCAVDPAAPGPSATPTSAPASTTSAAATSTPATAPPTSPAAAADGSSAGPPAPSGPAAPASPTPSPTPTPTAAAGHDAVVVRGGDTLWSIAAAELARDRLPTTAADVTQRWPAWWQANRDVIGPDPGLIHPGTTLVPPAPEETP